MTNPNNKNIYNDKRPMPAPRPFVQPKPVSDTTEREAAGAVQKTERVGNASPAKPRKKKERKIVQPVFESRLGPDNETAHLPPLKDGDIRIIHMGGVEEIGRNMSMVEYKDSIVIVDCGVQFSETSTPGIDFILPNTKYLEERKDKIKAIVITHGPGTRIYS